MRGFITWPCVWRDNVKPTLQETFSAPSPMQQGTLVVQLGVGAALPGLAIVASASSSGYRWSCAETKAPGLCGKQAV